MVDTLALIVAAPKAFHIEGKPVMAFTVCCSAVPCTARLLVPRPAYQRSLVDSEALERKIVLRDMAVAGWTFKRREKNPLCPTHSATPKEKPVPPALATVAPTPPAPLDADRAPMPTRKPTREHNNAILEELEASYDRAANRYKGKNSDSLLAVKLDVPAAWIATVRAGFFGDGTGNEEASAAVERVRKELRDRLDGVDSRIEAAMQEVADIRKVLESLGRK